jgi:hypothetical protein
VITSVYQWPTKVTDSVIFFVGSSQPTEVRPTEVSVIPVVRWKPSRD